VRDCAINIMERRKSYGQDFYYGQATVSLHFGALHRKRYKQLTALGLNVKINISEMENVTSVSVESSGGRTCLIYGLITEGVITWLLMVVGTIGKVTIT